MYNQIASLKFSNSCVYSVSEIAAMLHNVYGTEYTNDQVGRQLAKMKFIVKIGRNQYKIRGRGVGTGI